MKVKRIIERLCGVPCRKKVNYILVLMLVVLMANPVTGYGVVVSAQETKNIIAFEDLVEDVKNTTVPIGTSEEELPLPETVTATVEREAATTDSNVTENGSESSDTEEIEETELTTKIAEKKVTENITLNVIWESDRTFSSEEVGEFTYTAKLTEESYTLTEGIIMPTITVKVVNNQVGIRLLSEDGFADGGDVSTTGLDLSKNTPTQTTLYTTSNGGTILWEPDTNTVTLYGADISVSEGYALILPNDIDVTIDVEEENSLQSSNWSISKNNGNMTIQGNGTLSAQSSNADNDDIYSNNDIIIKGDVSVSAPVIYSTSKITVDTTGTITVPEITALDTFTYLKGIMTRSWVSEYNGDEQNDAVCSIYGNVRLQDDKTLDGSVLSISQSATLIVNNGVNLTIEDVVAITNHGKMRNNGTIVLPASTTAEGVKAVVQRLKPIGTGILKVNGADIFYTNSGEAIHKVSSLDLSAQVTETADSGYTWTGDCTSGYTLTLDRVYIDGMLTLPTNCSVTIVTNTDSVIKDSLSFYGDYSDNVTFKGNGLLTIKGMLSANGSPTNYITVDGTKLNVDSGINVYGSGNDGNAEVFQVINGASVYSGDGIYCSTVLVSGNSQLTTTSDSCGIMSLVNDNKGGNVTITDGSILTARCRYGVYIIGGKLTVDDTSNLTTNASVAPFCVVDKTGKKSQDDTVSLPGKPNGTKITYVIGEDIGCGYTYWSLVSNEKLSVVDENSEPASLIGAVKGSVTMKKAPAPNHVITAIASTGGTISPSGNVSVVENTNKAFTITPKKGYKIKSVLVDGVNIGAVPSYTFERVTKIHTIVVNFGKKSSSYDDKNENNNIDDRSTSTIAYTITATAEKGGTISPNRKISVTSGDSKTFMITTDEGYIIKDVLVDNVSVGAVTTYTFEKVTKSHTITVSFEKKTDTSFNDFIDVKGGDWFKDAVGYVAEKGLMVGIEDDKFGPNINTDRGMIVTILWRMENEPKASNKAGFTDVNEGDYYDKAVDWAAENTIVKGYGDGNFGPRDTITREQMAAILYRYSQFKKYDTTQGGMIVREFSDYNLISDWAMDSMVWAVNKKLISGKGNDMLDPCGNATRAEVSSILLRYCQTIAK